MSFFIETTSVDLGSTPIENIFLNDFMPMADGTYVKVYLLGLKLAKDNAPNLQITNALLSRHLNIPLSDVLKAWDFWESKGIIIKHNKDETRFPSEDYDVEFKSLVQLYIQNNYQMFMPKKPAAVKTENTAYKSTVDDLVAVSQNPHISNMFKKIDHIVRRQLSPNERLKVLDWFNNYNVEPDIIVQAFYLAVEKKGKKNINYVDGIIRNWYDLGITNSEDLENYLAENEEKHHRYQLVKRAIGAVNNLPTESEKRIMDRWFEEWNMPIDLVLFACEKSANTTNPSINYINGILSSWNEKGIATVEDAKSKDTKPKSVSKSSAVPQTKKTRFHNFEQRTSKYSNADIEKLLKDKKN